MEQKSVLKSGLMLGFILAGASIILTLACYLANMNTMGWLFGGLSWLVALIIMILGIINFRKGNGGYMTFMQGFSVVIIAGILSALISYFFQMLYVNYINVNYIEEAYQVSASAMEKMGVSISEEMEEQMRQSLSESTVFSIKNLGITVLVSTIGYAIIGAILGGVFSKKDPNAIEE